MGIREGPRSGDVGICAPIYPIDLEAWSKQRGGSVNRPDKSQSLCMICQWLLIAFLISGLKGLKVDLNTQENFLFLGVKLVSSGKDLILSKAVSSHLIGYPRDLKSLYKFWALASKSSLLEQMQKSLINWLYGRPRFKDMGWALFACKILFYSFLSIQRWYKLAIDNRCLCPKN